MSADDETPLPPPPLPILMASGFMPFPIRLDEPLDYFHHRGYHASVVPYRYRDMHDVRNYAAHIKEDLEHLCAVHDCERVNFLGFSLGGLAGLYAVKRHLGAAARIDKFVALGSPFHGVPLGWLAMLSGIWTPMGLQIRPNSPFLKELHSDPLPVGTRFVSIGGTQDAVCPAATSVLAGAKNVTLDFRHLDFFNNRSLFAEIECHF